MTTRPQPHLPLSLFTLLLTLCVLLPVAVRAAEEGWTDDMTAAMTAAREADRDILIDFTGSDWCPPCIALHENVFSQDVFKEAARERFELVVMDFPQNSELPEATAAQNDQWAARIGLEAFPTVLLLDSRARAYGKMAGYSGEGVEAFIAQLDEMQAVKAARDEAFAAAEGAEGQAAAEALDRGLSELDAELVTVGYEPQIDRIIQLTPEGSDLNEKYAAMRRDMRVQEAMPAVKEQLENGQVAEAVGTIDGLIERHDPSPGMRAKLLGMKAQALMQSGDFDGAAQAADALGEVETEDSTQVASMAQMRAGIYAQAGQWEKAAAALDEGIQAADEVAAKQELLLNKSQVYQFQGDSQKSLEALEQAAGMEGSQPGMTQQILANYAFVLFQMQKFDEAEAKLDEAIAAAPGSPMVGDLENGKVQIQAAKAQAAPPPAPVVPGGE